MPTRRAPAAGLAIVACAVAVYAVFSGALGYSFSQDDWSHLARARGLLPPIPGPWRSLSLAAFFEIMRAPFDLDPAPYHVASLLSHAACVALVYVFLSRRLSPPASAVGALLFAVHPSQFTVAYWVSAIGDALALGFALGSLCLIETRSRFRALAAPLFALSLLSKESTLLLPVVMLAVWEPSRWPRPPWRDLVWWACVVLAGCAIADILLGRVLESTSAAVPYSFGFGAHVATNVLYYLGWALSVLRPAARDVPGSLAWGAVALALWLIGLALLRHHRRAWTASALTWCALMAPVLALRHQTLPYYQYAGLVGVAWMVATVFEATPAPPRIRREWIAAGFCLLLVAVGRVAAQRIEHAAFGPLGIPANGTIQQAHFAARLHDALLLADLPPRTSLVLWSSARAAASAQAMRKESRGERAARSATQDGLSIYLLFPQVDSVVFARWPRRLSSDARYVVYDADGSAVVWTWPQLDAVLATPQHP